MSSHPTLLVVAKAPVPGFAKTRIAADVGDEAAAELAAAALLDTLATTRTTGLPVVVALTGDLAAATRSAEILDALDGLTVVPQRGDTLGERLAAANHDADRGYGVVQVGMDTPQLVAADYAAAADAVRQGRRVLGPATDGGWWLLGLPSAAAATALTDVPMSRDDTAARTADALGGIDVHLRTLTDMDTWDDAVEIARTLAASGSHTHLTRAVDRFRRVAS